MECWGTGREETIKFQPSYTDRGDHITLKGSWTKGGRRVINPGKKDLHPAAARLRWAVQGYGHERLAVMSIYLGG